MQKAIGSRINLSDPSNTTAKAFLECVQDLIEDKELQQLKSYHQHMNTTRYQHCVNVAYYTFLISRRFHLDTVSATRAALLHDFYLYNWRNEEQPHAGRHSVVHPQVALETARTIAEVNATMEDVIIHHMWPMTFHKPATREGWVVQAVDKYCALAELASQASRIPLRKASLYLLSMILMINTFH